MRTGPDRDWIDRSTREKLRANARTATRSIARRRTTRAGRRTRTRRAARRRIRRSPRGRRERGTRERESPRRRPRVAPWRLARDDLTHQRPLASADDRKQRGEGRSEKPSAAPSPTLHTARPRRRTHAVEPSSVSSWRASTERRPSSGSSSSRCSCRPRPARTRRARSKGASARGTRARSRSTRRVAVPIRPPRARLLPPSLPPSRDPPRASFLPSGGSFASRPRDERRPRASRARADASVR